LENSNDKQAHPVKNDPQTTANLVDELAEEFAHRWRAGERPSVAEYVERYPQVAAEILAVLPAVVMMEQLKPRREDAESPAAPASWPDRPPERIGEYTIVCEIGRGGMGVVYEANHEALGRRVAIKVLPESLLANEKVRSRFQREAQAAARLHHTSIVPVFGVGESNGQCYYVMQLIEGRGLDRVIKEEAGKERSTTLQPSEVARIGFQVADALAYAHGHGVLHRDIKPSNLLLDKNSAVWVTDFGVAKVVEGNSLTQSGDLIGTLKYMPPERFAGQSDGRGDVYSLGMTLYELLTLRPAFPDTTPHQLIQMITQKEPTRPRKLNRAIPKDLETIVLKAAARDPVHRYQTPAALAEDLQRFLHDRPILAKRTGPIGQIWRWRRRNPALAAACAAALLLMVAVTIVSAVAYVHTAAANRDMQKALDAEKLQRDHAENTATLALEALNRTFDRFAPTRLVVVPPTVTESGVEIPLRPAALTPEAVTLLEELLRTYEQIARSGAEFPKLRAPVAEANHRLGDIRRRLGRLEDAAVAYRTAIELYTQMLPDPDHHDVRIKLARAYNELGRTLRSLRQSDDSKRMFDSAIATLADAPKEFAARPECRYELACSYFALGEQDMFDMKGGPGAGKGGPGPGKKGPPPFGDKGRGPPKKGKDKGPPPPSRDDGPKSDNPAWRAVNLLEQLVQDFPTVSEYRHLLACCYRDLSRGGANADRAVDLLKKLVADFPSVPDYRLDLCETLARNGPAGPPKGGDTKARDRLKEAIKLSAELVEKYPNVPDYTAAHARYLDWLAMALYDAGKSKGAGTLLEAEKLQRKAVGLQDRLVKQYPDVVSYRLWQCLMERSLGRTLGARGELKEARALLEGATTRAEGLWHKDPSLGGLRPFLGMSYRDLGQVLDQCGEPALAAVARKKAEEFEGKGGSGL
jgi:tetratricopeptide (TPR) repeat protein/tRNA A-37 threonylcarbamoyl transferase component Bud32